MQRAMTAGEPVGPIVARYNAHLARSAVPEWQATLDGLQEPPEIGADGPVGYFGPNMGTAMIADWSDSGIRSELCGSSRSRVHRDRRPVDGDRAQNHRGGVRSVLAGVADRGARRITVPIEFVLQWNDEHTNAGRRKEVPRFEADSVVRFARHLGRC